MSVFLGPDSGSGLSTSDSATVDKPASDDSPAVEADANTKTGGQRQFKPEAGGSREPGAGSRIMRAVRNVARFAYDLLNDLF